MINVLQNEATCSAPTQRCVKDCLYLTLDSFILHPVTTIFPMLTNVTTTYPMLSQNTQKAWLAHFLLPQESVTNSLMTLPSNYVPYQFISLHPRCHHSGPSHYTFTIGPEQSSL